MRQAAEIKPYQQQNSTGQKEMGKERPTNDVQGDGGVVDPAGIEIEMQDMDAENKNYESPDI